MRPLNSDYLTVMVYPLEKVLLLKKVDPYKRKSDSKEVTDRVTVYTDDRNAYIPSSQAFLEKIMELMEIDSISRKVTVRLIGKSMVKKSTIASFRSILHEIF